MDPLHIQDPDLGELQKAYRKLARFENLQLQCEADELGEIIEHLEQTGFIGLQIHWPNISNKAIELNCTKGKHGPCYDTGQTAKYTGNALAVLDDDAHLIFRDQSQPICLKTAQIYQSDVYKDYVNVSEGDPEKLSKIESDPIPFDCDDYSDSVKHLITLCPEKELDEETQSVFYRGPFKAMISQSGHVIRRGQWCSIPRNQSKLLEKEGLQFQSETHQKAHFFTDLMRKEGEKALLNLTFTTEPNAEPIAIQLEALQNISEQLKDKLRYCIQEQQDYIMLVGSDPQDKLGCCPSEEVGMANQLMRAGILTKAKQDHDQDQCPILLYSFQGELSQKGEELQFSKNQDLRLSVLAHLTPSSGNRILKWALFIFILVSLALAFKKISERHQQVPQKQVLNLIEEHQLKKTTFVLFHHEVRCEMCLLMEEYTESFAKQHNLSFMHLNMDAAHWKDMIDQHQLFSAALFSIQPKAESGQKVTLIKEAWDHWKDPKAYHKILEQALP